MTDLAGQLRSIAAAFQIPEALLPTLEQYAALINAREQERLAQLDGQAQMLIRDFERLAHSGIDHAKALSDFAATLLHRRPSRGMRRHVRRMKARGEWRW